MFSAADHDNYLEHGNPYLREEEGCTCAGLGTKACPVHDREDEEPDAEA